MDPRVPLVALVGIGVVVAVAIAVVTVVFSRRLRADDRRLRRVGDEAGLVRSILEDSSTLGPRAVTDHLDELRVSFGFDAVAVLGRDGDRWLVRATAGAHAPHTPEVADHAFDLGTGTVLAAVGRRESSEDIQLLELCATQVRQAQEQMRRVATVDALPTIDQRADEVRSALLTAVSHDLRSPLAAIKAAATSILSPDVEWSAETIRLLCHTIDAEADRLNGVVGNLLDMSRLHTGAVAVSKRVTAVDEIVDGAIARFPTPHRVVVAIPASLPSVDVDAVLIGRALANVFDNARRWSGECGVVAITAEGDGDRVVLRVVDHGPGISALRREAVVRPLQRLGDGPGATQGLGLGLAVASGLVEANGGALDLDDTPGGGLTVSISLPAAARVPR